MLFPDSLGPRKQHQKSYGVSVFLLFCFDFFVIVVGCVVGGGFVGLSLGWGFLFGFGFSLFSFERFYLLVSSSRFERLGSC